MMQSIMIVDDDPRTRTMLRILLEMDSWEVSEASDGLDALAQVILQPPDIMLLDVMMPNMDGITLCKQLRSNPDTADLPIIMLSGKTQSEAVAEGLSAGANAYLGKPFDTPTLLGHLRTVVA